MSLIIYWIIGFVLYNLIYGAGTWKLYQNAGKPAWSAFLPFLNIWNGLQIIDRPKWWIILFYLPIVGPIFWLVMYVDLADCYGKIETKDKVIMVLTLGLYIFAVNYSDNPKYLNPEKRTSTIVSSIVFALVLATLVHNWFIQPMIVPTGSMENTIKIGDALFVEKVSFGARVPVTPLGIPFSEFIKRDAFVDQARFPYMRLPGWRNLQSNDIVVFNYPTDTVYTAIDRKDAYVKRLVGMPGETVSISNGILYVDGKKFQPKLDAQVQHSYKVVSKVQLSPAILYQDFGLIPSDYQGTSHQEGNTFVYGFPALTDAHVTAFKNNSNIISVEPSLKPKGYKNERIRYGNQIDSTYTIFPVNKTWNEDQYGPLYIPKKGDIVDINKETLPQYINVIRKYEYNTLRVDSTNGKYNIYINDKIANKYEVKQNYYFMMGDNRNQSLDARYFGYVPEDHIIGRPILIWANMNGMFEDAPKKFIWSRFFTSINNGDPNKVSYGIYVLIAFIGWIGYDIWKARKEKQKNKY